MLFSALPPDVQANLTAQGTYLVRVGAAASQANSISLGSTPAEKSAAASLIATGLYAAAVPHVWFERVSRQFTDAQAIEFAQGLSIGVPKA